MLLPSIVYNILSGPLFHPFHLSTEVHGDDSNEMFLQDPVNITLPFQPGYTYFV